MDESSHTSHRGGGVRKRTATKTYNRVVLLSEIFHPDSTSTGYYITRIADHLARDFAVEVVCARPFGGGSASAAFAFPVRRFGRMSSPNCGLGVRLIGAVMRCAKIFIHLLVDLKAGDIVLVVTNPPLLPAVVALASVFHRSRVILLIHDVYPGAAAVAGIMRTGSPIYKIVYSVQRWVLRRAVAVICLGRDMRNLVGTMEPSSRHKIVVIPNWAEAPNAVFDDKRSSRFGRTLINKGAFVVLHAGNLGRTHDADVIIEAAGQLRGRSDILIVIATANGGPMVKSSGADLLSNIQVTRLAPERDQQWDTLAAGDVVLISFKAGMGGDLAINQSAIH